MNTEPHLCFIGRWNPLHRGHKEIMLKKINETGLPLLVLVRDTDYDGDTELRVKNIRKWMTDGSIDGTVMIIPNIRGVYYGRQVGYEIQEVKVSQDIAEISGTKLRAV